jgi:very-short-patch-repair endonuclease
MRKFNEYKKLPYNPKLKERAKKLRKSYNLAEALLWSEFKSKKSGLDFDRQKIIGNYIVDFYCAKKNCIIEIDGASHTVSRYQYDRFRDKFLLNLGLSVIHILDSDVRKDPLAISKYVINVMNRIEGKSVRVGINGAIIEKNAF